MKQAIMKTALFFIFTLLCLPIFAQTLPHHVMQAKRIIVFVWDGMRPDSISPTITPHLFELTKKGVYFTDNHSSYPTFTMMNASSFATGDFAGETGFYGNTLWDPKAVGPDSQGVSYDFRQPVFTEDYKLLEDLNHQAPLTVVGELFSYAHQRGITTAAVGKSGPAFFQNYAQGDGYKGIVFDEKHVYPLAFAKALEAKGYRLPALSPNAYPKGELALEKNNGDPTAYGSVATLKDGVTSDPTATSASPYAKDNAYLMKTYLTQILPVYHPTLSFVWLRNPDTTEHNYGVGTQPYVTALKAQDQLLGELEARLKQLHEWQNTDLIIVSDHGHSNVSGPLQEFPLRDIQNAQVTTIDGQHGLSVSGDFRPADLLTRAGFHAYDGTGCEYDPVLTGEMASGNKTYQTHYDKTGSVCGKHAKLVDQNGHRQKSLGERYTTPSYLVPKRLPKDAIIVAANGGSTYFYVPSHNKALVAKLVRFVQTREEFGAVFVDQRYGQLPGTLPLHIVKLHNLQHRNPDVIAGSHYEANVKVQGMYGIEFNSDGSDRGMHGSFSPRDVHNTLVAFGPDFKTQYRDALPTGNVDLAPTLAHILGFTMPNTDGRVLMEALSDGWPASAYTLFNVIYMPPYPAKNLVFQMAENPDGKVIDKKGAYTIKLKTKQLFLGQTRYTYFDYAKAIRS